MREAWLAVDLGTSGCRAECLSQQGVCLGRHTVEYGWHTPEPGAAEQRAEDWLEALITCVRGAYAQAGEPQILAIGLSVQGHTWLPVNANLQPLRPALTWLDTRAAEKAQQLRERHRGKFWGQLAGKWPGPWHMLPQWLWLQEHEPEILAQTRYLLSAHDYLIAWLTGELVTDYTHAATTLLLDITQCRWAEALLAEYGIGQEILPKICPAGTLAGQLKPEAAAALGLPSGIPVAVGAQDQKCAALAAGIAPGTATASLGTATALSALIDQPRFSAERGAIPCFPFVEKGVWILEAPLATTGGALRWLRDLVRADEKRLDYEAMIQAASLSFPGAEGVLFFPYLAGAAAPFWESEARGAFAGLTLACGLSQLTRAVLEATAYDMQANLSCLQNLGCRIERLILFGGGARSALWAEIISATCGLATWTSGEGEAASRGAAMLAARALGQEEAPLQLALHPVRWRDDWAAAYARLRDAYAEARTAYFAWDRTLRNAQR